MNDSRPDEIERPEGSFATHGDLAEARGEVLAELARMSQSINGIHELASDTRRMLWDLEKGRKPHAQGQTIATGGVLAVLANQLIPQFTDASHAGAQQTPFGLVVTLAVLVASLVMARRQGVGTPRPSSETPTDPPPALPARASRSTINTEH